MPATPSFPCWPMPMGHLMAVPVPGLNLGAGDLLIGHGAVGRAEVDRTLGDLENTAPGADGLIVDFHARMRLAVFAKPLGVDGIRKGRSRSVDVLRAGSCCQEYQGACCDNFQIHCFPLG